MKSTGSWGMMASLLRRSSRPICAILIPSMIIEPPVSSTSLNRATPREDFPENTHAHREDTHVNKCVLKSEQRCKQWKWKRCRLGSTKRHSYLILCVPQCRWSLRAEWWRTGSWAPAADRHDSASPHSGRWSFPAGARRGQEHLPQDCVGVLHSLDTKIRSRRWYHYINL